MVALTPSVMGGSGGPRPSTALPGLGSKPDLPRQAFFLRLFLGTQGKVQEKCRKIEIQREFALVFD